MSHKPNKAKAHQENFAIYMLRGWKRFVETHHISGVLSGEAERELLDALDYAVTDIKVKQNKRRRV